MFGAILRRRQQRRRLIFSFHDGAAAACADPLAVLRLLEQHGGENWTDLVRRVDQLRKPAPAEAGPEIAAGRRKQRDAAAADLAALARKVFELKPLGRDGSGLADTEAIGVLVDFLDFLGGLAEATRPLDDRRGTR